MDPYRTPYYRVATVDFAQFYHESTIVTVLWEPGLTADEIARLFINEALRRQWKPYGIRYRRGRWINSRPPYSNFTPPPATAAPSGPQSPARPNTSPVEQRTGRPRH